MVSNKFLAALSVKLGFHRHLRFNGAVIESQNREYVVEIQDAEREAKGAPDYWTNTKQPPKVSIYKPLKSTVADIPGSFRHRRIICWRPFCGFRVQFWRSGEIL